jgi:hypothetical protein
MKRFVFVLGILALGTALFAQEATVVYIDGWVDIRDTSGTLAEAWEGDMVTSGESVITGEASYAELEKEGNAAIIRISPDTVFTIEEIADESGKREVMRCSLGSVQFKFNRLMGTEPRIATPSVVAGVRGTEFTVFAGVDGSTLIGVTSGEVEVTASGESVSLYPDEGVEVLLGEPPGEKFTFILGEIDYSDWNADRFESFLRDPNQGIRRIGREMDSLTGEIDELRPIYLEKRSRLDTLRSQLLKIREEEGKEASAEFYEENIGPLEAESLNIYQNLRYYAISALSLRQYVMSRLYLFVKMRALESGDLGGYRGFRDAYDGIVDRYEKTVSPLLSEGDI